MPIVSPTSLCRMGIARCEITPPVGIYHRMWGAATHDRATGVHRPLTATVVVFEDRQADRSRSSEQIVVALDHCLLWARDMELFLDRVAQTADVPRDRILVAFSHTHAAGLMDSSRADLPGGDLIAPYLEATAHEIGNLIAGVRETVEPVTITYGTGRCDLAGQRDYFDSDRNQYVCGFNPAGRADDTVLVARVTDDREKTIATFVNYACHPTTLAFENTLISPDFPGMMRETIERETDAPCIFLQGASGDLGPREGFIGDTAVADRNGRQLGHAALAALDGLPPPATCFEYAGPVISGATLGIWKHRPLSADDVSSKSMFRRQSWTVELPYRSDLGTPETVRAERDAWLQKEAAARDADDAVQARNCRAMVERMNRRLTRLEALPRGPNFPLPVTLWQMGDAFWLAVEAEHYQLLQTVLREKLPDGMPLVVMTIVNGSRCSYLPTADAYGKGIYQETIAVLAAGSLEKLIEEIRQRIDAWSSPA
jgi:hypothetical protein